ncbi:MAG TPA: antibiotic biosynthesis monooxygenase [Stellaceae bacterium]
MPEQVSWQVELAVKAGELDNFRRLTGEMVEFARQESGVLSYQRFVTADGQFVHIYERYLNSAAAAAHLRQFRARFGERFSRLVRRLSFTVYGDPSAELRALLDGFGASYLAPFGDLEYW